MASTKPVPRGRNSFECTALVLQGGGALGSYQAGVYEALAGSDVNIDWVAGISIGAINSAIIAGNAPKDRVAKLKGFWESITVNPMLDWAVTSAQFMPKNDKARGLFNQFSAGVAMMKGAAGFFSPRSPAGFFNPDGSVAAISFYDTSDLKATLERFVDFDRINSKETRLSVGTVHVKSGNFRYFDNCGGDTIRAEHIMASGSLPPGFAATEIDGEFYWDGGLISNTPLQWIVDSPVRQDTLAFQVDLWNAEGKVPTNLMEVATRQKEIQYSSRTRANSTAFRNRQRIRYALANLLPKLPQDLLDSDEAQTLRAIADRKVYNLVQLIYRPRTYEGESKDYEFSRLTMNEHWLAGYEDAAKTLSHEEIFDRPVEQDGVATFDFLK